MARSFQRFGGLDRWDRNFEHSAALVVLNRVAREACQCGDQVERGIHCQLCPENMLARVTRLGMLGGHGRKRQSKATKGPKHAKQVYVDEIISVCMSPVSSPSVENTVHHTTA